MTSTQELEQYMNGLGQPPGQPSVPPTMSTDTPLAYYTPVAITPASIKWVVGGVVAAIWSLYTADFLYRPAKASDLEVLTKVVHVVEVSQQENKLAMGTLTKTVEFIQATQEKSREAVERMTLAVDNLSHIVVEMQRVSQEPVPVAPRVVVRRTRPPAPLPATRPTQ